MKRLFTSSPMLAPGFLRWRPAGAFQLRQHGEASHRAGWRPICVLITLALVEIVGSGRPLAAAGPQKLLLETSAFQPGGFIPGKYTCSGENISPALSWRNAPRGTTAFALIVTDPDAPGHTWVHWVVYNMPSTARQLSEGVSKAATIEGGGLQGSNDFRDLGYGGPCPPPGKPHRYFFRLYALNAHLNLKSGATRHEVEAAMKSHVLAEAELMGRYGR
ncbi:MAG: YbhB/YbcL family Raf kinase inhibitor-like protein [Terriglobia bacterium]